MLVPIFSLKLNNKICARTVVIGKYDGIHPCLSAATLAGKVDHFLSNFFFYKINCLCYQVFIHNPHQKYSIKGIGRTENQALLDSNLSLLNINAVVSSLAAGMLDSSSKNDALLVGTKTSLLAYDVNNNSDLFFKEVCENKIKLLRWKFVGTQSKLVNPFNKP